MHLGEPGDAGARECDAQPKVGHLVGGILDELGERIAAAKVMGEPNRCAGDQGVCQSLAHRYA